MNTFIFIIKKKKAQNKCWKVEIFLFVCFVLFWNMFCSIKENRTKDIHYSEIFFFWQLGQIYWAQNNPNRPDTNPDPILITQCITN